MADSTASTNAKGSHWPPGTRRLARPRSQSRQDTPPLGRPTPGNRDDHPHGEPVFCVGIIRLAAVHDPVQKLPSALGRSCEISCDASRWSCQSNAAERARFAVDELRPSASTAWPSAAIGLAEARCSGPSAGRSPVSIAFRNASVTVTPLAAQPPPVLHWWMTPPRPPPGFLSSRQRNCLSRH